MYLSHRNLIVFVLLATVVFINACTRAEKEKSAASFSIPVKMTKMLKGDSSTVKRLDYSLNYVALNITSSGMADIFCAYDYEFKKSRGECNFKSELDGSLSVQLEITNGSNRLFQVVTANRDDMDPNGSMTFYYADSLVSLSGSDVSVPLTLEELNGGISQSSGHISGRYITGGTVNNPVGPTGIMELKLKPKDGKPAVIIQQTEMYSGWFQAFGLESTAFEYSIRPAGQATAPILMFGRPMKKVDFVALSVGLNLNTKVQNKGIEASAAGGAAIAISTGNNGGNEYEVVGFYAHSSAINALLVGKVTTATGSCASVVGKTAFENCMSFQDHFQGPFKAVDSYGAMLGFAGAFPSPTNVTWSLLPGIVTADNSVIDGITVLQASFDLDPDDRDKLLMDRAFNCEAYKALPGVVATEIASNVTTKLFTPGLDQSDMDLRPIAICPRKGGKLRSSAVTFPDFNDHGGGGGGASGPYLRIELNYSQVNMDKYVVASNGCYPVNIASYVGYGSPMPSSENLVMDLSATWGTFHYDSNCADSPASQPTSVNIPIGYQSNMRPLFFQPTAAASINQVFTLANYDTTVDAYTYQSDYNKVDIVVPEITYRGPTQVVQNLCYEGTMSLEIPGGGSFPYAGGSKSLGVSVNNSEIIIYNTRSDCTGSINPQTSIGITVIPGSGNGFQFSFKKIVSSMHNITGFDPAAIFTNKTFGVSIGSGTSTPAKYRISGPTNMELGACYAFKIESVNDSNTVVPAKDALLVAFDPSPFGEFYSNGSCSGYENFSYTIMQNYTETMFFYKPIKTGNAISFPMPPSANTLPVGSNPDRVVTYPLANSPYGAYLEIVRPKYPQSRNGAAEVILGSHQFPYPVHFVIPSDANVSCSTDYGATWSDCGGQLHADTKVYDFRYSDFTNYNKLRVSRGGNQKDYEVQDFFKNVDHRICDEVQSSSANFTMINSNSAIQAATTVCFGSGTGPSSFSKGGGADTSLALGAASKNLIGYIDFSTGDLTTTFVAAPSLTSVDASSMSGNTVLIANFKFQLNPAGSVGIGATGNPSGLIESRGNLYDGGNTPTQFSAVDIGAGYGGLIFHSRLDIFKIVANASGAVGLNLNRAMHEISQASFTLISTASELAKGITVLNASGNTTATTVTISDSKFTGSGNFIYVEGDTVASSNWPTIDISTSEFNNVNTHALGYSLYLKNSFAFQFAGNKVFHSAPVASVKMYMDDIDGRAQNVTFSNNRFVNSTDQSSILFVTDYGNLSNFNMLSNQFVKATGGGSTAKAINFNVAGGGDTYFDVLYGPGDGKNLFCGVSGSATWAQSYIGNTIYSSGMEFIPPAVSNTASATQRVCTH